MKHRYTLRAALALAALSLSACGGGLSGEYGNTNRDGEWETAMTFKGDKVELDMGLATMVGSYEVRDKKVYISMAEGVTQAYPIDDKGCIDGGMFFGTACKKK